MNRHGFTLIELMAVVSVIAILLAVATLNFSNWMLRQNIDSQVKEMYADIMSARQRAMVTGVNCDVAFPDAKHIVFRSYSTETETRGVEGIVIQRKELHYPVVLGSTNPVEFNERGMMIDPVDKTICVFTDAQPSSDALVITQSRVSRGRIKNQGSKNAAACTKGNIEIK